MTSHCTVVSKIRIRRRISTTRLPMLVLLKTQNLKLNICIIIFEITQLIHNRYRITDGQTIGQMDGRTIYGSNTVLFIYSGVTFAVDPT